MRILQLPALRDNYIYLLYDPETATAAVVDPAVAEPVLDKLAELGAELVAIFNTHHHHDHVGATCNLWPATPAPSSTAARRIEGGSLARGWSCRRERRWNLRAGRRRCCLCPAIRGDMLPTTSPKAGISSVAILCLLGDAGGSLRAPQSKCWDPWINCASYLNRRGCGVPTNTP